MKVGAKRSNLAFAASSASPIFNCNSSNKEDGSLNHSSTCQQAARGSAPPNTPFVFLQIKPIKLPSLLATEKIDTRMVINNSSACSTLT